MKNKREIIESKYPPRNNEDIWLKDLQLYTSTTKGWLPLGSEKTYSSKEELLADKPAGGTIGIDKETGIAYLYNDVSKEWSPIGDVGEGITQVTWLELKDKRDAGKLTPGALYRITDYNCTTTQENTQSAGHQFDIVLLALSEDKLAEEGWAMMHDNIYDVTFDDEVTKKCWLYPTIGGRGEELIAIVDVVTQMGLYSDPNEITINESEKTAITEAYDSEQLEEENVPYNYFQNSNLSAWKVWYCLDNDTARFAWADDRYSFAYGSRVYNRAIEKDFEESNTKYFAYDGVAPGGNIITVFFTSEVPKEGDIVYQIFGTLTPTGTIEVPIDVKINGRGVIYRLIDEWNNDCPYDFKNILYLRNIDNGTITIDDSGENVYVPTFCLYDIATEEYKDASIHSKEYTNDEDGIGVCHDNHIYAYSAYDNSYDPVLIYSYILPNNVCYGNVEQENLAWRIYANELKGCVYSNLIDEVGNCIICCSMRRTFNGLYGAVILDNKIAVYEDIS